MSAKVGVVDNVALAEFTSGVRERLENRTAKLRDLRVVHVLSS